MTDEVQQEVVEDADIEQQAMAAGFAGEEVEAPEAPEVPEEDVVQKAANGVSPEQFQSLLARMGELDHLRSQIDRVNGRIGTLMQDVDSVKKAPPALATPPVAPIDEAEFVAAYGEDVAKYVEQTVGKRVAEFTQAHGAPSQDVVDRITAAEQSLAARQEAFQEEINLTLVHSDWRQVVESQQYQAWLQLQAENVRQVANSTERADELGVIIGAFKQTSQRGQSQQRKKQRLEGAVVPAGVASSRPEEMTEGDAMKMAFARARGQ